MNPSLCRFTYSVAQVLHHVRDRSSFIATRSLSLHHNEVVEQLHIELRFGIMSHRNHRHISLTVHRDEDW